MAPTVHPSLLADMRLALLGEIGARAIYARLAHQARDPELRSVLNGLWEEEVLQVNTLSELMRALGAVPPQGSKRRTLAAGILALSARVVGLRFALRVCSDAEATSSRWYQSYARYLTRVSAVDAARRCEELSLTKRRHAQILETWIQHGAA
jgi:demethoxyubiquinone hydroxylase (CLK1/Coq7/Cat5 family)